MPRSYKDCVFFAEKTSARKGAGFSGTVLVLASKLTADMINGSTFKALGVPRDGSSSVPLATWVSADYLARSCAPITETQARALAPAMFAAIDSYQDAPEYRAMHPIVLAEAIHARRYSLQSADDAVNARLATSTAEEVPGGFVHRRRR